MTDIKAHIRTVPDFPKKGILFYDIGSLIAQGPVWQETIRQLCSLIQEDRPTCLLAIEARGFLLGSAMAAHMGIGLIMLRKKGKLPGKTACLSYDLEYGQDTLEVQTDFFDPAARYVLVDDFLATGGTARAAIALAQKAGGQVISAVFLAELSFLKGKDRIQIPVKALLDYAD